MAKKTFYTEQDIQTLADQGQTSITLNDDVVLTDLARECAAKLGITLTYGPTPSPTLPTPPSLSPSSSLPPQPNNASPSALNVIANTPQVNKSTLATQIKATVIAKMGSSVPEDLLDAIIPQVLAKLGITD